MHSRAAVQGGNEMDVTVLIPAYQPAGELVALVKALKQENFRIVVVDDGSGRKELGMTLELNHRFIDGYHVGQFNAELCRFLEALF